MCVKLSCRSYEEIKPIPKEIEKKEVQIKEEIKTPPKEMIKPVEKKTESPKLAAKQKKREEKKQNKYEMKIKDEVIEEEYFEDLQTQKVDTIETLEEYDFIEKAAEEPIIKAPLAEAPKENALEKEQKIQTEYFNEHLQKIVQLLQENLYYPRSARKRGVVGEVLVRFKLSKDAKVSALEILSSKNEILSRAAIKTIENLSGVFPKPKNELFLSVPIHYTLSN